MTPIIYYSASRCACNTFKRAKQDTPRRTSFWPSSEDQAGRLQAKPSPKSPPFRRDKPPRCPQYSLTFPFLGIRPKNKKTGARACFTFFDCGLSNAGNQCCTLLASRPHGHEHFSHTLYQVHFKHGRLPLLPKATIKASSYTRQQKK